MTIANILTDHFYDGWAMIRWLLIVKTLMLVRMSGFFVVVDNFAVFEISVALGESLCLCVFSFIDYNSVNKFCKNYGLVFDGLNNQKQ